MTIWKDPPPKSEAAPAGVWLRRLAPLVSNPGQWGLLRVLPTKGDARSTRRRLVLRKVKVPPGRFEFVDRGTEVYGRYLGPEEES